MQQSPADRENRVRSGDFATVERVGEDNALSARLDSGRAVVLDPEGARHIDYGYTVESVQHISADRLLLTGEGHQLAEQQAALTRLNPHTKDIAIYTLDALQVTEQQQGFDNGAGIANEGISNDSGLSNMPEQSLPELEFERFGLGL